MNTIFFNCRILIIDNVSLINASLLSEELIDEFSMFLSWFKISKYCILTENIIQKYIDKLYISTILNNRMISVEMKLYATKIANELFWEM